jgi:hypothetical protein
VGAGMAGSVEKGSSPLLPLAIFQLTDSLFFININMIHEPDRNTSETLLFDPPRNVFSNVKLESLVYIP